MAASCARRCVMVLALVAPACSLHVGLHARAPAIGRMSSPSMGLFDGLKGAFDNDSSLGPRENAGLTKEATKRTVTWIGPNGKKKTVPAVAREIPLSARCLPPCRLSARLPLCCPRDASLPLQSTVVPGQRMRDIARGAGIPVKYDCQEGTCKTCEATVNGARMKLCVGKMVRHSPSHPAEPAWHGPNTVQPSAASQPNKDATVKYNIR